MDRCFAAFVINRFAENKGNLMEWWKHVLMIAGIVLNMVLWVLSRIFAVALMEWWTEKNKGKNETD
jgi:hypothetical protein